MMVPECAMPRVLHEPTAKKIPDKIPREGHAKKTFRPESGIFHTDLVWLYTALQNELLPFIPNFVRLTTLKLVSTKLHLQLGKLKNGPIYHIKFFYHSSPILLRVITTLVISYHNDQTSGTFSRENSVVRYVGKVTTDFRPAGPSIFAGGPLTFEDPLGI